ncbi:IS6 family transposase, partial [Sphingomonas antarctica]|uniref:IS6 family transposase n=1 Tax=Sphingomonas antarctica TaxID=2040274 RepID=UPI0039E835D9
MAHCDAVWGGRQPPHLFERGIDICHETVRMWWNRFGPMFAGEERRQRVGAMRGFRHWRWHLDDVFVKINGEMHYLWRAFDHEGEVLESYVTKTRDKAAALTFMKKALKRHGSPEAITTDGLASYRAAMKVLGNDLPPAEWPRDYDSLDHERDDECRARSTSRKRLSGSCVKLR